MLTADESLALCAAATTAAEQAGTPPMSFAVMDPGGHLVALVRMDGALWITATVAQGKAWTAAAYGAPSHAQKEKMAQMPNFASALTTMTGGAYTPQTGGVPVYRDGVLLGGVGASGGTGDEDQAAVTAAVESIGCTTTA